MYYRRRHLIISSHIVCTVEHGYKGHFGTVSFVPYNRLSLITVRQNSVSGIVPPPKKLTLLHFIKKYLN